MFLEILIAICMFAYALATWGLGATLGGIFLTLLLVVILGTALRERKP